MGAGKYRHRIMLQRGTVSRSSFGETEMAWTDYKAAWAEVTTSVSNESGGDREAVSQNADALMRYRSDITTQDMRFVFGGVAYEITGYAPDARRREVVVRGVWRS